MIPAGLSAYCLETLLFAQGGTHCKATEADMQLCSQITGLRGSLMEVQKLGVL